MASKATIAEELRRMAIQYQSIVEAADAIEQIGSIEQAVSEAIKARKDAEAERDSVLLQLEDAKQDLATAKDEAAKIISSAKRDAEAIIMSADADTEQTKASATEQGQALIDAAKVEREQIIADATAQLSVLQLKLVSLQNDVIQAESLRDSANAAAQDAQDKLSKIQASIRKLAEV